MPQKLFAAFRGETAIVLIVFTLLVGYRARRFAGRLARRLAFAAAAVGDTGGKIGFRNRFDVLHH